MRFYLLVLAIVASSTFSHAGFLFKGKKDKDVDLTGSATKEVYKDAPKWYTNVKEPKGWKYQKAMATSRDAQTAIDKAYLSAKTRISALMKSEVSEKLTRATEELGLITNDSEFSDDFERALKSMSADLVEGLSEIKSEVILHKGDNFYTAYYLIGYDIKEAEKRMLNKLKEEELYDDIKTSEIIKELESDIEEYQKKYNN